MKKTLIMLSMSMVLLAYTKENKKNLNPKAQVPTVYANQACEISDGIHGLACMVIQ